jgi:acetyl esterase/lipase
MKEAMPSLSSFAPLARHAIRVPMRRAFGPKDEDHPRWSPTYEILVRGLREVFKHTASMPAHERRAYMETLTTPSTLVWKLRRERISANGVPATWFLPPKANAAPVMLYLHGGAYQFGSVRTYTDVICRIALEANIRVLAIDYRLAPEHPFPAPLEDALKAWEYLRARAYSVVVAGDSAGGNLALSLALALKERGDAMPKSLGLICPWVDIAGKGASIVTNARWDTLPPKNVTDMWTISYAAGHRFDDPRLSPTNADLRGLPPMLVHAGGREILRDDLRAFSDKAKAAGVAVEYSEYSEMVHDWHMLASFGIPESRRALAEIARFAIR